jgi:hypothetical protein
LQISVDILEKNEEDLFQDFVQKIPFSSAQNGLNWRNLICDMKKDRPYFIVTKQNNEITGALPLYFFKSKFGNVLTSNAFNTISGILCSSKEDLEQKQIYELLLGYSISLAHEMDCSVLTVGTNPLIDDKDLYSTLQPDYILENFVQYISIDEIFDKNGDFKHPNYLKTNNLTRNLNKLKQCDLVISDEQDQEYIDQAFLLQQKRMRELGAFQLPKSFFDSALKNLSLQHRGKFLFAFYKKRMVATCLFLQGHGVVDVYMLCMDSEFKDFRPNFAITKYLLEWAYKNKVQLLNWMSSPIRGDGVYRWKAQWGSRERTFRYLTRIIGDVSNWRELSVQELAKAYKFHYLLPFNSLNTPKTPKTTTKDEVTVFIRAMQRIPIS